MTLQTPSSSDRSAAAVQPKAPTRLGIIGLGLIAGSLASALRAAAWIGEVRAWDPNAEAVASALNKGLIDAAATAPEDLIGWAEMIVIGAPPIATAEVLAALLPACAAAANPPVVTDLASIKGHIATVVPLGYPLFVPGHPIAGSEDSGVAAARADLFAGREIILTPRADTDPDAIASVEALWRLTGAWITRLSVTDHDAALAASSHSPHMIAYALTRALGRDPLEPMRHGGGALRDMTRIAGSDPVMWRDVALTNRPALLAALGEFSLALGELCELIAAQDGPGLEAYFLECRNLRRAHDRILNPLPTDEPQESSA